MLSNINHKHEFAKIKIGICMHNEAYTEELKCFLESYGFSVEFNTANIDSIDIADDFAVNSVDIVIIDPDNSTEGREIIKTIREKMPNSKIMLYTASLRDFFRNIHALLDYYTYDFSLLSVFSGILKLAGFNKNDTDAIIKYLKAKLENNSTDDENDIEAQIIKRIKSGKKNEDIARELIISVSTLKNHLRAIYKRYGVSNKWELVDKLD